MIESVSLFAGAISVGALVATALSLYGAHIATRDTSLQSLAVSQGAQLGVLIAIGLFHHSSIQALPWLGGILVATVVFVLSSNIAGRVRASKNTVFIVFFLVLLASSYCLVSVLPMLDSHQSQSFFGDLVYLSGAELVISAAVSSLALVMLVVKHRAWANRSFLLSTCGADSLVSAKQDRLFLAISLLLIVTSVFSVGLLLTLSALFVPTMVLSFVKEASLKRHMFACAAVAFSGVIFGFLMTLKLENYPTVPVVVLAYLIFSVGGLLLLNLFSSKKTY